MAALLNGLSQVFITTNPWTGLLILIGVGLVSVPMASLVLLGAVITTAAARAGHTLDRDARAAGLAGYNGALIGAASFMTWHAYGPALATTILGSLAGATITELLVWLFQKPAISRFSLPVLTAPFCIASGIIAMLGSAYAPSSPMPPLDASNPLLTAVDSILGNISEVILVDNIVTGLLILAGLTIASWKIGLAAFLGAVGEFLIDLLTSHDIDKLVHGLLGYSGVLVTIALGVVFVQGSWKRRTAAAALGLLVSQGVAVGMSHTQIPTYTWPFIIPTWLVLIGLSLWDKRTESGQVGS